MRHANDTTVLVSVHDDVLRPVRFIQCERRWVETPAEPIERRGARLERPFAVRSILAPGPHILAPDGWGQRHREFHVKPTAVLADSGSLFGDGMLGPVAYRVQASMTFWPTPRWSSEATLQRNLLGCHLVIELVSEAGFTIGWEGPRWHVRYGEGMSLDGACPLTQHLVTADEFAGADLVVDHSAGQTVLKWATLLEFSAFANRYIDLDPEILLMSGWPSGPTLAVSDSVPALLFDGPRAVSGSDVWARSEVLGHVECTIRAQPK